MLTYTHCTLCPRRCGVDRAAGERGFCAGGVEAHVAWAGLHHGEEPPVSGTRGSGTIFFSGCTLRCPFCQNHRISRDADVGRAVDAAALAQIMLDLQGAGAHNINLVTPTHYLPTVVEAVVLARPRLALPIVCNCGGYERPETVRALAGVVDVWLPDFKYGTAEGAVRCGAPADYPAVALSAIAAMVEQAGAPDYAPDGTLRRGVIVRHLVLPGGRRDSVAALEALARRVGTGRVLLSLMRQYTPPAALPLAPPLNRTLTTFEYESVRAAASALAFAGFAQDRAAVGEQFVPAWDWCAPGK